MGCLAALAVGAPAQPNEAPETVSDSVLRYTEGELLSLAEAIGRAGGLLDGLADPAAVFLYRGEARDVVDQLLHALAGFFGDMLRRADNVGS